MQWIKKYSDRAFGHWEDDSINHCRKCKRFRSLCLRRIWHLNLIIDLMYKRTQTKLIKINNQTETSQLHVYNVWQIWREWDAAIQKKQRNWTHRRGGEGWGPTQGQQSHQHSANRTSLNLLLASSDRLCKFVSQKPTAGGRGNPGAGLWNTHTYLSVANKLFSKSSGRVHLGV